MLPKNICIRKWFLKTGIDNPHNHCGRTEQASLRDRETSGQETEKTNFTLKEKISIFKCTWNHHKNWPYVRP